MKKYTIVLLVILLIAVGCFRGGSKGERMQKYIAEELSLTPLQQDELKAGWEEYKNLAKNSNKIIMDTRDFIYGELQKDNIDKDFVSKKIQEKVNELNSMVPDYVNIFADLHTKLTPEQKVKLQELVKEHKEHRGKHKKYRRYKGYHRDKNHDGKKGHHDDDDGGEDDDY